jgi:hypothetical protein
MQFMRLRRLRQQLCGQLRFTGRRCCNSHWTLSNSFLFQARCVVWVLQACHASVLPTGYKTAEENSYGNNERDPKTDAEASS